MKLFLGKKKYLLCPKTSILYFLIFILLFALLIVILEFLILNSLKKESILSYSDNWAQENHLININNYYKRGLDNITDNSSLIWRDKAFNVIDKKTTSKRILVVGDSFVWGDGYANMNDIWWRRLQRELVKRNYYDVEVIALGLNGLNSREELEMLKKVLRKYNPDIVVWGYVTNDPDEYMVKLVENENNISYETPKDTDIILNLLYFLKSSFPNLTSQLFKARTAKLSINLNKSDSPKTLYNYDDWELALLRGNNFEQYKKTVNEISSFIRHNNEIPVFFITLPTSPSGDRYYIRYKKILCLFKSNNIKMYDLLPKFIEEFPIFEAHNWSINPANGHPGVLTNDYYSKQVVNILEKDYPKCLPKKYSGHRPSELFINDWVPMDKDIKQNGTTISFDYPTDTANFLSMPYGYKYFQLNLSYPVKVKKIIIEGKYLSSARLDIKYDDPIDLKVYQLGFKKGQKLSWTNFDKEKLVNSVKVSANFNSDEDRNIIIKVITEGNN